MATDRLSAPMSRRNFNSKALKAGLAAAVANASGVVAATASTIEPATVSHDELLNSYSAWLHFERMALTRLQYPEHPNAYKFVPMDNLGATWHAFFDKDDLLPGFQTIERRAAVVMTAAGLMKRIEANRRGGQ